MASLVSSSSDLGKQICPHCDCLLSRKAIERHRKLYYDASSSSWIKKRCLQQPDPVCEFEEPSLDDFAFDHLDDDSSPPEVSPPPPLVLCDQSADIDLRGKNSGSEDE